MTDPNATVLVSRRGRLGALTLIRPSADQCAHSHDGRRHPADPQRVGGRPGHRDGGHHRGRQSGILRRRGRRCLRDAGTGGSGSEAFWRAEYLLNATIASYPKPYVALMDGIVLGGGVGLFAHASHRIVMERTRIGMPEVGIGFVPDLGGTWLLATAPGELVTYVALTAAHLDVGDVIGIGLADHLVEANDLPALVGLLEHNAVDEAIIKVARSRPEAMLVRDRAWIDEAFAHDDARHVSRILAARPEPSAQHALTRMATKSPTSLAVTLRAVRAARHLTLGGALAQEYRVAVRMLHVHDLSEGIRAQVLDKDWAPRWSPPIIDEVTPELVARYFEPLGQDELVLGL